MACGECLNTEKCKRQKSNCDKLYQFVGLAVTSSVSDTFYKSAICQLVTFEFISKNTPLREYTAAVYRGVSVRL